jgi:hypothetical protein
MGASMAGGFTYRCEATSVEGFVQQLAVSYVRNGYFFYVTGSVREGRDPRAIDRQIIERYRIDVSKFARARRKKAGCANLHYLRHKRFFVILATVGRHLFYEREANVIRDIRRAPIVYEGYAVGYANRQATVRIDRGTELNLRAYFEDVATRYSAAGISRQIRRLPFQPYGPVRRQLRDILAEVNRLRRAKGLEPVPMTSVRWKRWIVKPFGEGDGPDSPEQAVGPEEGSRGASPSVSGERKSFERARTR